ncbi:hypothetical protein ACH347_39355 [Saccharopolyspora sp. 5N102]|uniref:AraC-like ligand-binding domain-containing protein n=1 Tax=Saccharopolyspora sp. 5N102 TaxID=3375155 RepID=UPI0037BA882D
MIETVFTTIDLPPVERIARWNEMTDRSVSPTLISSDDAGDFRATLRVLDFGTLQVSIPSFPSLRSVRTPKLIRQADPEIYHVGLAQYGTMGFSQLGRELFLGPRDLMIYSSSYPFESRIAAGEGEFARVTVVQVPRALLPLPSRSVDRLLGGWRVSSTAECWTAACVPSPTWAAEVSVYLDTFPVILPEKPSSARSRCHPGPRFLAPTPPVAQVEELVLERRSPWLACCPRRSFSLGIGIMTFCRRRARYSLL